MKKFLLSFKFAIEGIIATIKKERNIKIHILAVIVVTTAGFIYQISEIEWVISLLLFSLVISSELINTAIEKTIDAVIKEKNELAKLAKDAAAGAVLVNAVVSVIIGIIIFYPKIF